MTVKEYLSRLTKDIYVTFIKARARKDASTPFYHAEYQETPFSYASDWLKTSDIGTYIILNDKQMPITWLSGANWEVQIKKGYAKCLLVISPKDFEMLYPDKEERNTMMHHIDVALDT